MNTHGLRSMFKRRNVAPCALLLSLVGILVVGFTASTAPSAATHEAAGSNIQRPPDVPGQTREDIEKEFNDDDLKEKEEKPRGKWGFGLASDMGQFNDSSVPVVVSGIQSLSGGGKYRGVTKTKRVEIKNRSPKTVNSVQLRWTIVNLNEPEKVLSEGTVQFVNTWVEADNSRVIEIPTLYHGRMLKPLAKNGELYGEFMMTIGVQEARFADGSFWRLQAQQNTLLKLFYPDQFPHGRFPTLASQVANIIPQIMDRNGNRGTSKPCEAQPRSIASAVSFMPFQIESCHNNMTVRRDDEGKQSCGNPLPGTACYQNCSDDGWCSVWLRPGTTCAPTPTPTPAPAGCSWPPPAPAA